MICLKLLIHFWAAAFSLEQVDANPFYYFKILKESPRMPMFEMFVAPSENKS